MPLETGDYVANLDPANPTGADPKSAGDDHIRRVKAALRDSFVGFSGAILVSGADGGAENAYTLTPARALKAYTERMMVIFRPTIPNSGPITLNVSALGAKEVVSVAGVALVSGDITAGRYYTAFYDGTRFRLDNVTQNYVDQLVISGTVPGVNEPANANKVFGSDGASGKWFPLDGRGDPVHDNGSIGTGTLIISYTNGDGQKAKATGSHTLTATGFPVGRLSGILLELTDYGAYVLTTTGITWIKADGSETTDFSKAGIALPASGRGRVVLYSLGDGIVYGKSA